MRKLAALDGSSHHLSLSFAVGVLVGFSPFLGLHTAIALSLCFLTGLNKPALMIGNFLNMPWVVPAYYSFSTWLGILIIDMPGIGLPTGIGFRDVVSMEFLKWIASQWVLLVPAFVGSTLMAVVLSALAYLIVFSLLARFRPSRKKSVKPSAPAHPNCRSRPPISDKINTN